MGKLALVTGGAGFIGSHIAAKLLREGWNVRVLDDFSAGRRDNLPTDHPNLEIWRGDVRDLARCREASAGADTIFHLAALVSVISSIEDPLSAHEVNVTGTLNVLQAARETGARRFVFTSSAAVYGDAEVSPTDETQPLSPQSPYASHKACGEFYGNNFALNYGLEVVHLRYFNVFGPRQNITSGYAAVIPLFVRHALRGTTPTIFGDGLQTRDFVYAENVAQANFLAATAQGVSGQVFNIAGGQATSLLDLLALLARITGRSITPKFEPTRTGEVRHSRANIEKAQRMLGYVPTVSLEEGLRRTLASVQEEEEVSTVR